MEETLHHGQQEIERLDGDVMIMTLSVIQKHPEEVETLQHQQRHLSSQHIR